MAFFKRVPSDGQKGKVSYNFGIVSGIVQLAVAEVEGVALPANKKRWLKLYNEYITDVIIAAIVYLSAFALVIRMMIAPKKKLSAEPETEGAVTAEKADNADTEKGGDEA